MPAATAAVPILPSPAPVAEPVAPVASPAPPIAPQRHVVPVTVKRAVDIDTADTEAPEAPEAPQPQQPVISDGFVLGYLRDFTSRPQKKRDAGSDGYSHVTTLISQPCMRKIVLMRQHGIEEFEKVSGGHHIMWAQGRATEAHIREAVISEADPSLIYGRWVCSCKRAQILGTKAEANAARPCNTCFGPLDTYGEPELRDHDLMVTGSPDLTFVIAGHMLAVEIKSMTPDDFDELEAPKPDHVTQVSKYRDAYKRLGFLVSDSVVVIYGRKQFKWGSTWGKNAVYKEFRIDATTGQAAMSVRMLNESAAELMTHCNAGTRPDRDICDTIQDSKAKSCCVNTPCFNLD